MYVTKDTTRAFRMLLFSIFCLLPAIGFTIFHSVVPSDGARLAEQINLFTEEGAVISPFGSRTGPLQEGDVVTAVNGIPMEILARGLFSGGVERPEWEPGQKVTYDLIRNGQPMTVSIRLVPYPWMDMLRGHWGALVFAFISQVVAGFVYLKRREDPAAQALLIWAMSGSHTYAWSIFLQVGDLVTGTGFWIFRMATPLLWLIYWPATTHVALVFPRPLSFVRKYRWLIPGVYAASFVIFSGLLAWNWVRAENLLLWLDTWGPVDNVIAGLFLLGTMTVVVFQQRRARSGEERRQIRWAMFGALASGLGGLTLWFVYPLVTGQSAIDANLLGLISLPFPVFLALAIWRYRLFDIDVIIRRTLQYSVVTVLLAGLYFTGIVVLQAVFQALTGSAESPLITVLSTLGIAALFNPLRSRVQDFIDRRFYRTTYDAEQILNHFAAAARDEVDLEVLSVALLGAVDESMQPEYASLWITSLDQQQSHGSRSRQVTFI